MNRLPSKTEPFQTVVMLVKALKNGEVTLKRNDAESIEISIENNQVLVDFLEKDVLRAFLELEAVGTGKQNLQQSLNTFKNLAEELRQSGFTIRVFHKGRIVLTLGSEAHSTISQIFTGTKAIEINNLAELLELIRM